MEPIKRFAPLFATQLSAIALLLWIAGLGSDSATAWAEPLERGEATSTDRPTPSPLADELSGDGATVSGGETVATEAALLAWPQPPALADRRAELHRWRGKQAAPLDPAPDPKPPEDTTPRIRISVTGEILDQPVFTPFRREGTVRESSQPVYVINRQQM